ncbi:uncharacterized protein AMSG_12456 [Thecamonas trahens ATCC 50062]|uniref:Uncharacterized protein n=1 Tax=Thecamonas trahens ATCC 50062 TaxID=461836 RepID=A0A0L0DV94_THETB|nr:hypothetical protein AMSG_12456 [Thecamonas trahens ATCC 50062]KNC56229.1 hypothetical protein AMSG_12456 [Thecamonas trahens ATCC 50062]|eukprot:XP_013752648.1 hypothetical protein AMSG_12456 [Thecamonas trahens ATCC 50062]
MYQFIASGGGDGTIALSHASGALLGTLVSDPAGGAVLALAFSAGSRYVVAGGMARSVQVWDLKTRSMVKSFDDGHAQQVTRIVFTPSDKAVVSGDAAGVLLVHSLVHSREMARLEPPSPAAITDIGFSPFKKSLLAATHDDGSFRLWNVSSGAEHAVFPAAHDGPASGLAFSPVNHLLCTTVGHDKRIVFYDVFEKKIVKVIHAPVPLSCIAFLDDGFTLVVGTTAGSVLVYNLKARSSAPATTLQAHPGSSVAAIDVENTVSGKRSSARPGASAGASAALTAGGASAGPATAPVASSAPPPAARRERASPARTSAYSAYANMDMFSPLKGSAAPRGARTSHSPPRHAGLPPSRAAVEPRSPPHSPPRSPSAPGSRGMPSTYTAAASKIQNALQSYASPARAPEDVPASEAYGYTSPSSSLNLHVDMLRQFQVQQAEIVALLEKYSSRGAAAAAEPVASTAPPPSSAVASFFRTVSQQ